VLSIQELGALAGGVSADLVRPDLGIHAADDHLNLSTYVGMMATVVARTDTPLPLSIGLFGEWGSGKSTFMGLLRGRVAELSSSGSPDYLRDVVQIGFNAWTYADADLWASLGDEIFRALIGPEATDDEMRQTVRSELDTKLARADELAAARDHAASEAASLQNELDQARTAYIGSLAALGRAAGGAVLDKMCRTSR
jgi:predicted KAP-like P-loop ATPase